MTFRINQRVTVYPKSWILRRYHGWNGTVDTVELEDDGQTVYRVKLDNQPGQGYPYYASEVAAVNDKCLDEMPDNEHIDEDTNDVSS